jgi:hypothetical protein
VGREFEKADRGVKYVGIAVSSDDKSCGYLDDVDSMDWMDGARGDESR